MRAVRGVERWFLRGCRERGELVVRRRFFGHFPEVHVGIGAGEGLTWGLGRAQHGNAGRSANRNGARCQSNSQRPNAPLERTRFSARVLFGQVPQKYRELIATEARDDIRIAAASDDDFGNSLQRRIAGQVAELVVDAFEVIEIDKDDGGAAVV